MSEVIDPNELEVFRKIVLDVSTIGSWVIPEMACCEINPIGGVKVLVTVVRVDQEEVPAHTWAPKLVKP